MAEKAEEGAAEIPDFSDAPAEPFTSTAEPAPEDAYQLLGGEDQDFMPKFEDALKSIFDRFDCDGDKLLSVDELHDFARSCNGKPFPEEELQEMRDYLDWDEKADSLKMSGFMQMYHMQTSAEPHETWKDLRALGYDWQLELNSGVKLAVAAAKAEQKKLNKLTALQQAQSLAEKKVSDATAIGDGDDDDDWLAGTAAEGASKKTNKASGEGGGGGGKGKKKKKKKKKKANATEKTADGKPVLRTTNAELQATLDKWDALCTAGEIRSPA